MNVIFVTVGTKKKHENVTKLNRFIFCKWYEKIIILTNIKNK